MTVSDNGKGILDGQEVKSGGFGMLGMRERVKQLGGTIRFDSPAIGGLCLMVAFPLIATLKI
jgi:signal transduction histidine kinase